MDAKLDTVQSVLFIIFAVTVTLCVASALVMLKRFCCGTPSTPEGQLAPEGLCSSAPQLAIALVSFMVMTGVLTYWWSDANDLHNGTRLIVGVLLLIYYGAGVVAAINFIVISVRRVHVQLIPVTEPVAVPTALGRQY